MKSRGMEIADSASLGASDGNGGGSPRAGRASFLRASYLNSYLYFFFYSYRRSFAVRPGEVSA
jgi:hypothetical protein